MPDTKVVDPKLTLDSIARTHFHQLAKRSDPLATQNSDRDDFLETAVWAIRAALEEAYQCGWADAEAHHKVQDAYGAGTEAARQGNAHTTNPPPERHPSAHRLAQRLQRRRRPDCLTAPQPAGHPGGLEAVGAEGIGPRTPTPV